MNTLLFFLLYRRKISNGYEITFPTCFNAVNALSKYVAVALTLFDHSKIVRRRDCLSNQRGQVWFYPGSYVLGEISSMRQTLILLRGNLLKDLIEHSSVKHLGEQVILPIY